MENDNKKKGQSEINKAPDFNLEEMKRMNELFSPKNTPFLNTVYEAYPIKKNSQPELNATDEQISGMKPGKLVQQMKLCYELLSKEPKADMSEEERKKREQAQSYLEKITDSFTERTQNFFESFNKADPQVQKKNANAAKMFSSASEIVETSRQVLNNIKEERAFKESPEHQKVLENLKSADDDIETAFEFHQGICNSVKEELGDETVEVEINGKKLSISYDKMIRNGHEFLDGNMNKHVDSVKNAFAEQTKLEDEAFEKRSNEASELFKRELKTIDDDARKKFETIEKEYEERQKRFDELNDKLNPEKSQQAKQLNNEISDIEKQLMQMRGDSPDLSGTLGGEQSAARERMLQAKQSLINTERNDFSNMLSSNFNKPAGDGTKTELDALTDKLNEFANIDKSLALFNNNEGSIKPEDIESIQKAAKEGKWNEVGDKLSSLKESITKAVNENRNEKGDIAEQLVSLGDELIESIDEKAPGVDNFKKLNKDAEKTAEQLEAQKKINNLEKELKEKKEQRDQLTADSGNADKRLSKGEKAEFDKLKEALGERNKKLEHVGEEQIGKIENAKKRNDQVTKKIAQERKEQLEARENTKNKLDKIEAAVQGFSAGMDVLKNKIEAHDKAKEEYSKLVNDNLKKRCDSIAKNTKSERDKAMDAFVNTKKRIGGNSELFNNVADEVKKFRETEMKNGASSTFDEWKKSTAGLRSSLEKYIAERDGSKVTEVGKQRLEAAKQMLENLRESGRQMLNATQAANEEIRKQTNHNEIGKNDNFRDALLSVKMNQQINSPEFKEFSAKLEKMASEKNLDLKDPNSLQKNNNNNNIKVNNKNKVNEKQEAVLGGP